MIFLLKFILNSFKTDYVHIILHEHCNIKFTLPVYSFNLNLCSAPKDIIEVKHLIFWLMYCTSSFPAKPIYIYIKKISLKCARACKTFINIPFCLIYKILNFENILK